MNVREVCLGQLGQRPKQPKQGLQSPDPYAHLGQLKSGDNALDIDHHGVFRKQIPPLLRSPASGGTMSHRQMECFVGLRSPRNDEGRCNDVFVVSASSRSAEGAVAICPAEGSVIKAQMMRSSRRLPRACSAFSSAGTLVLWRSTAEGSNSTPKAPIKRLLALFDREDRAVLMMGRWGVSRRLPICAPSRRWC